MLTRCVIGLSLAATLAAPLCVRAQDFTPISDRILSDPTYLPLKGEFYGATSYSYEQGNTHIFDASAGFVSSTRGTQDTIHQTFAFGITDELSFNITEAYTFYGRNRVTSASGVTETGVSGFEDPTLGLTYRVIDQRSNPASVDIFADYSPDAFTNKSGSPTEDASVARGGPAADFGIALGRETRFFTIRGLVTATYLGGSTFLNTLTGGSTNTASYWTPSLGIQTQARFTDRLSANLNGSYTFNSSPVVTNNVNELQHTNDLGDYENVNVALNYHFIPNRLVGSVSYGHTFYDHTNLIYPTEPALDGYRWRSGDTVGVLFRYTFK